LSAPTWDLLFRASDGFPLVPSPVLLRAPSSSSHELCPLYRVRPDCHLPRHRSARHLLGFPSPSRHQHAESTSRRVPTLVFVTPSAFLTPSTLYSSTHLAGLFHPTATSGIRTSGVFPAAKLPRLIDEPYPHAVSEVHLPASCLTGASFLRLAFRASIRAAVRCN
jgi:hypothetical protein